VERLTEEGLQVAYHRVDVTVAEHGRRLARHLDRHYGRLDVLVNNAGVFLDSSRAGASALETRLDRLRRTMETNVYGALRLCQALVPLMQRHGYGRIVNVASGMGQLAEMGGRWPAYRVSKTALNALTRILAAELAGSNILVNSVCPGWVRTDMGGPKAERSVEQGVETIVWLATRPDGSPSGDFYRDRRRIPW
jgi:NAD(P)-dependent dehydrogenase (short-subunit alcohol dehydrogenase family)